MTTDEAGDREALVERLRELLRAAGTRGNIAWDRATGRLLNESWPEPLYVEEIFHEWPRVPEDEREGWLGKYVDAFLAWRQVPETWEEARDGVMPRILPRVSHAIWPLQKALEGYKAPERPHGELTPHLVVEFAWPQENALSTIRKEDVESWGVTLEAVQDAAMANLVRRTEGTAEWLGSKEYRGVWRSPWQDRFDPSRVLLGSGGFPPLEGPPVVIALGDRYLVVAGGDDADGLFNLGRWARREMETRRSFLWLRPLRYENGAWRHWLPDPSHGAFSTLKLVHDVNVQTDYRQHGHHLARLLEREEDERQVAPLLLMQDAMHDPFTAAVWQDGRPQLLPLADAVLFRRGEEDVLMAPYPRVVEVLGQMLDEQIGYPPRLLAHGFPEDWQLEQLRPPEA